MSEAINPELVLDKGTGKKYTLQRIDRSTYLTDRENRLTANGLREVELARLRLLDKRQHNDMAAELQVLLPSTVITAEQRSEVFCQVLTRRGILVTGVFRPWLMTLDYLSLAQLKWVIFCRRQK
jgi:hypothetical protein